MDHWNKSKDISEQALKDKGISRPKKWEVIYETISRWSLKHIARINEKAEEVTKKIPDKLKKEITDAARAVDKSTHEEVNASSQAEFLLKVATGEYRNKDGKTFETTAKMKDGTSSPLTNIAEKQRIKTKEFMTPPKPVREIKNAHKKSKAKDHDKYVLTGHTGATHFNPKEQTKTTTSDQIVSGDGSAREKDGIHGAQLRAQQESSHHLSFSRRLSAAMDKVHENGDNVLAAYDNKGFHELSNWQGNRIERPEDALAVAVKARHVVSKRRSKEKEIRRPYLDTDSMSEEYSEINTDSEANSDSEQYEEFAGRVLAKENYKVFAEKHNVETKSQSFLDKLNATDKNVSGKVGGR